MLIFTLVILAITAYSIAGGLQFASLTGKVIQKQRRWFLQGTALLAICIQAYLLYRWIDIDQGQNLTFLNVVSQVAWIMAVLVLIMSLFKPIANIGIFAYPFAALSILLVALFPHENVIDTASDPLQLIHILSSFFAMSVFCVAATQALLMTMQERALKQGRVLPFLRALPPLETMERILFQLIILGFILLCLIIVSSLLFFSHILLAKDLLKHSLLALVAWLTFAILLYGRFVFGWRGQVAIRWTLTGFVLLLVAYFGSWLVVEIFG